MMVPAVADDAQRAVSARCRQLLALDLGYCALITDLGLRTALRGCGAGLRELSLAWCEGLTPRGLASVAEGCRLLERVNLSRCPGLRDAELLGLSAACGRLARAVLMSPAG